MLGYSCFSDVDGLCAGVGSCPFVDRAEGDERTSCEDAQSKQVQPKSTDGPKVDDAAVMSKPCVPTTESMKINIPGVQELDCHCIHCR
jgi:hypothetical protein